MRILIIFILVLSCSNFQQTEKRKKVARVNSIFLYESDLENEINAELSEVWPNITEQKAPLPECEEFEEVKEKKHLLER